MRGFGSSPLTRGKRCGQSSQGRDRGLIPAHAGKTSDSRRRRQSRSAHPRSRGENLESAVRAATAVGSSPLTRGKPHTYRMRQLVPGLIPAHAGKTDVPSTAARRSTAHPRSRGENALSAVEVEEEVGSSPLTRGKPHEDVETIPERRLIPAHAGKTPGRGRPRWCASAHPRSRGENEAGIRSAGRPEGSSPLTRGKHFLTCVFIAQIGQILESLELCASSESYSSQDAYATGAPQDRVRSIGLVPRSSRDAS